MHKSPVDLCGQYVQTFVLTSYSYMYNLCTCEWLLPGAQCFRVSTDSQSFWVGANSVERSRGMEGHSTHCLRVLQLAHFNKLCFRLPWLDKSRKTNFLITCISNQHKTVNSRKPDYDYIRCLVSLSYLICATCCSRAARVILDCGTWCSDSFRTDNHNTHRSILKTYLSSFTVQKSERTTVSQQALTCGW